MHGIRRQLTAAYTPQQNGVAERKNCTIMSMVRSMLTTRRISKSFWPEAVNWSVHVLNRCPTFAVKNMTLEEAWATHKPTVDHFRIFGCIAYAHISDEKRKKLDDKGVKCIFLGVSEESKTYRLYNLVTKRIIVSRDVIFDEEHAWDWNNTGKQPSLMNVNEEEVEKETTQYYQQSQSSSGVLSNPSTSISNEEQPPRASSSQV